ncbi:SPW repeat protein [Mesorhizobium sp. VK24D]|uniref:SPW repeat protein n=1 Tax=Mesorhizobium album TaxID=3072314 RepID=A0ABU4XU48_9HYPH|nr:SPW repeat protein [Mesorhizobium sp. VK24D]MDX8477921.1 SPW repeat protein [Mesorhizobium sp. VK24D]
MEKKSWRRAFLRAMIALWILISPWVLVHLAMGPSPLKIGSSALWNFLLVGLAMMVTSMAPQTVSAASADRVNAVLAVWLVISPWVFGFSSDLILTLNAILVGVLTLVIGFLGRGKPTEGGGVLMSGARPHNRQSRSRRDRLDQY